MCFNLLNSFFIFFINPLTISPPWNRHEQLVTPMLDANRQRIRRNIIARGDCLILNRLAGERKVHLIPAVPLLQFVRGLGETHKRNHSQQHQDACHICVIIIHR